MNWELPTADRELPAPPPVPVPAPLERVSAAIEVLLCSGFPTQLIITISLYALGLRPETPDGKLSAPFVYALTLTDTVLVVGLVVLFFRSRGESFRDELFGRFNLRDLALGLALIPLSFLLITVVLVLLQLTAPWLHNVPKNPFAGLVKTRLDAAIFMFVVTVSGGVREEIQRGFILRRFEQYLGGGLLGLPLFSVVFGLGHFTQGWDVAVATAVLGAYWGAIFLARRSVLAPMIGHAGFNLAQVLKIVVLGS